MQRLRNKLTRRIAKILYLSICYVYLTYCNAIWSSCSKSLMQSLFVTQKKLIRLIMNKGRQEPSSPLFKKLNLLQLTDINGLNSAIYVYKTLNNIIPSPITFQHHMPGPYNLRRNQQLNVPFVRSRQSQRFLQVRGPNIWNNLPADVKASRTLNTFKFKLKKYYLHQYT